VNAQRDFAAIGDQNALDSHQAKITSG